MRMNKQILMLLFFCCPFILMAQNNTPMPTKAQQAWHEMEFYLFMHFGPNTFTGLEWGHGNEKEEIFDPKELDCEQWCRIAKACGAKGIIITAKHHDGFCLWPSKYSTHTVRESKWKNGKGDVLKDLSAACKKYGLKFGVYISPWDRNHPDYGTEKYNDVFVNMMKELFTNYGPIWELWWDGANGEGPNGKQQVYDWRRFENTVRKLSPNTIIFSDIGPDARWCGNENGIAGQTNWNTLDTAGFTRGNGAPTVDTLNTGNINGKNWIPAECDVSIRPGWFWHDDENLKVKNPQELFNLYLKSVGRGANLLLNVPPNDKGLITPFDSAALVGFKKLKDASFKDNIAKKGKGFFIPHNGIKPAASINDGNKKTVVTLKLHGLSSVGIEFKQAQSINCIVLKEDLTKGQNCKNFQLHIVDEKQQMVKAITGTTIGNKRIISFPKTNVSKIVLTVTGQKAATSISEIEAYLLDESLIEN